MLRQSGRFYQNRQNLGLGLHSKVTELNPRRTSTNDSTFSCRVTRGDGDLLCSERSSESRKTVSCVSSGLPFWKKNSVKPKKQTKDRKMNVAGGQTCRKRQEFINERVTFRLERSIATPFPNHALTTRMCVASLPFCAFFFLNFITRAG